MGTQSCKVQALVFSLFVIVAVTWGCGVKSMVSGYETKINFVGRVVDAEGDKPISAVAVTVTPPNSDKQVTARTGQLGYFEFQNLTICKIGGMGSKGSSGGLVTVEINHSGYKPFASKYPTQGLASMGSALSTTDVGTIKLERSEETSAK